MTWDEWKFSTRMAWEKPGIKILGIGTLACLLGMSGFAAFKVFGASLPVGYTVTHYTVYLGIDQVLPVYWFLLFLFVPILLVSGTIVCGMGMYRDDVVAGTALMVLAAISTLLWSVQLFYLSKINI